MHTARERAMGEMREEDPEQLARESTETDDHNGHRCRSCLRVGFGTESRACRELTGFAWVWVEGDALGALLVPSQTALVAGQPLLSVPTPFLFKPPFFQTPFLFQEGWRSPPRLPVRLDDGSILWCMLALCLRESEPRGWVGHRVL